MKKAVCKHCRKIIGTIGTHYCSATGRVVSADNDFFFTTGIMTPSDDPNSPGLFYSGDGSFGGGGASSSWDSSSSDSSSSSSDSSSSGSD